MMIPRVYSIALNTFRESVRSKLMYGVLVFAVVLVGAALFFGKVTIGSQAKIVKDFGLFCISLSGMLGIVISGSLLLAKELEKKTIFNILGKAVSRADFIIGKYCGLVFTMSLLTVGMTAALAMVCVALEGGVDMLLFQAAAYMVLELIIIGAFVMFFSSVVVTPLLVGAFSFSVFIAGRCADYLLFFIPETGFHPARLLHWVLPHLSWFNIGNDIVYGVSKSAAHLALSSVYACSYAIVVLILAIAIFGRRQFL